MVDSPDDSLGCYLNKAKEIFKSAEYEASGDEVENLAAKMQLLEKRGLGGLNKRLIDCKKKIYDTFSEFNFASMLVSRHSNQIPISWELPEQESQRRPDFKIVIGELTFWVQVKRPDELKMMNLQDNFLREIENGLQKIRINKRFDCYLSRKFTKKDIAGLIDFIAQHAKESIEGEEYFYPNSRKPKGKVNFGHSDSRLSFLKLSSGGDMEMVDVTGKLEKQIKNGFKKAAGAFKCDIDQCTINLIAIDADNKANRDLCNAIFGTELIIFRRNMRSWRRKKDGFFNSPKFSKKVAGVIVMKRKEKKPVSDCFLMLFLNDNFKNKLNDLNNLSLFDKVIYSNMRPLA